MDTPLHLDIGLVADYYLPTTEMIFDSQFHPDTPNTIAFGTIEGDVHILKFSDQTGVNQQPEVVKHFASHHNGSSIRKVRFWDNLMFTASRSIKLTDMHTGTVIRKITNHKTKLYSLLVVDNYLIAAGDDEGHFKVWDYRADRPLHMSLHESDSFISDLDLSEDRRTVVATSGEGTLTAFNLRSRKMELQSELFDSGFQCVRYLNQKSKVIVGSEDGVLNIFNNNEWGNISDRYPVRQNNTGLCSIDVAEVLSDEDNLLMLGYTDGALQAVRLFPHKVVQCLKPGIATDSGGGGGNVGSEQVLDEGIETLDVNQVTKHTVATVANRILLHSYDVLKDERQINQVKQAKVGTGFFDELAQ